MLYFYTFKNTDQMIVVDAPEPIADALVAVVAGESEAIKVSASRFLESGVTETHTISRYITVEDACPGCEMPQSQCVCGFDMPDEG